MLIVWLRWFGGTPVNCERLEGVAFHRGDDVSDGACGAERSGVSYLALTIWLECEYEVVGSSADSAGRGVRPFREVVVRSRYDQGCFSGGALRDELSRSRLVTTHRACTATTKAGLPCPCPPLREHDVCLAHANAAVQAAVGFGGSQPNAGRPPRSRFLDVQRAMIEADVGRILAVHYEALEATTDDGAPDHAVRLRGAEALLDRAYGKPTTRREQSGPEGGVVSIATLAEAALAGLPDHVLVEGFEAVKTSSTA